MIYLSKTELLFWGGIGFMAGAAVLAILCIIIFTITGRIIKRKLEQEYGKPWK